VNCFRDGAYQGRSRITNGIARLAEILRILSRLLALLVLMIYLPAMAGVALLVLLTSPGPALVKKAYRRRGGSGEIVYLYEFRTECWRTWQRTTVGSLLQLVDLHRLPRLLNVLQGDLNAGERVQAVNT
jgi:lipopolysaccharide/colanic/teichoic acid biosynthesis glycosyltransferase